MTAKTDKAGSPAHPFLEGPIAGKILQLAAPGLLGSLLQSALFVAAGSSEGLVHWLLPVSH